MDTYTLLYLKGITNKDLLYSTGNSAQCYVAAWMGGEFGYIGSLVAQMVKCLPAMQETWVQSLGQEDPLEKEMQPTPVFLPGKFHGQRRLVGYR